MLDLKKVHKLQHTFGGDNSFLQVKGYIEAERDFYGPL